MAIATTAKLMVSAIVHPAMAKRLVSIDIRASLDVEVKTDKI
jgi:hypothetical protein